ncbi:MAG: hypothetical protein LQ351_007708 [Letrouitia transgressa]|nr:MAG: hypothetical protein LQ351_007708 [Letrouitia transgressa]
MKLLLMCEYLLWAFCFSTLDIASAATCSKDNSNPSSSSSASAFCATYTTTINTRTTEFPSKATSGCGIDRNKYSSACSCNYPATTTSIPVPSCAPTPSINLVKNGGFECGLAPWVQYNAYHTEDRLYQDGDNSKNAYVFFEQGPPDLSAPPSSLSQDVAITTGKYYILTFRFQSAGCGVDGTLRLLLNGQIVDSENLCTVKTYTYLDRAVGFTATGATVNVKFEFRTSDNAAAFIDNIVLGPASA